MEAVIVAGLIAIIAAIFLPNFFRAYQSYRSETAMEQIRMNLRFARMAAVKKRRNYRVVFNAYPVNSYQVLMDENKDLTYEATRADTSLPEGLRILTGGITMVTFNGRGAATIVGGSSIRVQPIHEDIADYVYRINVFTNGMVSTVKE